MTPEELDAVLAEHDVDATLERAYRLSEFRLDERSQCLRHAAAATLRIPPERLPRVGEGPGRFDRWAAELEEAGWRIEDLALDELPPPGHWVACIPTGPGAHHAVGMVGWTPLGLDDAHYSVGLANVRSAFKLTQA